MQPCMILVVPLLASNAMVRHIHVSLPLVEALVDGSKYMLPAELAEAERQQQEEHAGMMIEDRRRQKRESAQRLRRRRGPSLQTLVRLVVAREEATAARKWESKRAAAEWRQRQEAARATNANLRWPAE